MRPAIEWRDLLGLNGIEVIYELSLSLPWLAASWVAAYHGQHLVALCASFMFFLTGLRQVHGAYHYSLGVSRGATEWVMFVGSLLMLGSMHAIQATHLLHHRHCMTKDDVEGTTSRAPAWQVVLLGPLFPLRLHAKAIEIASSSQRRWIWVELAGNLALIIAALFVLEIHWLRYHVTAMLIAQCLTGFFAVWTVHHDCDPRGVLARTIRHRAKALLTYNMFFHVEHHLFPAVPTSKLPILARRLDAVAPELATKRVF